MLVLKTSAHVRMMRHLRTFRSIPNSTGVSMHHLERTRLRLEEDRLLSRMARRDWLVGAAARHAGELSSADPAGPRHGRDTR